jgi:hypothetical protein
MRWIGHKSLTATIGPEVGGFKCDLPEQYFVAKNQSGFGSTAAHDLEAYRLRHVHNFRPPVGVGSYASAGRRDAKLFDDISRHTCSHGTRINERLNLAPSHVTGGHAAAPRNTFVNSVYQGDIDANLTHECSPLNQFWIDRPMFHKLDRHCLASVVTRQDFAAIRTYKTTVKPATLTLLDSTPSKLPSRTD